MEWVVEERTEDGARGLRRSDGQSLQIPDALLSDDVEAGDIFRLVAQVESDGAATTGDPAFPLLTRPAEEPGWKAEAGI